MVYVVNKLIKFYIPLQRVLKKFVVIANITSLSSTFLQDNSTACSKLLSQTSHLHEVQREKRKPRVSWREVYGKYMETRKRPLTLFGPNLPRSGPKRNGKIILILKISILENITKTKTNKQTNESWEMLKFVVSAASKERPSRRYAPFTSPPPPPPTHTHTHTRTRYGRKVTDFCIPFKDI